MNKHKRKLLLMLFSVLISCCDGIAQTVSHISGTVVEYKGDAALPVPSATVSLWRADSTLVNNTASDLKGKFQLKDVAEGDYFLKVSCIGYTPAYVALKGLKDKLDMGIVELVPEATALDEVAVEANSIVRKIDRMVVYPSADAVRHSYDPYDLIANLMIPRLHVNQFNKALETDGGSVQIRINGVKATQAEYLAIPAEDIKRIEVVDNPGMRYGDTGVGMVVDLIVKRREIGGTVYAKIMSCPYQLYLDPTFSLKLNHKKSQWGVYYSSTFRDAKKSYSDTDESFYLGDRVIHRIKEGLYAPYRNAWHNIDLTYNLYDVDNYTLNVAFRNSLYNVPYGDSRSRMYDAGNPDYIISHTQSDSHSYTPSLDIYFQKKMKNGQDVQVNVVGTLINSDSHRLYREYREDGGEDISNILTDVDTDKKSIWGEAIYGKSFDKVKLDGGIRHNYAYTDNVYTGDSPARSSMYQMNSSVFVDLIGSVKGVNYMVSLGGTRSYFKEGNVKHTYYTFTPVLRLNGTPHKNGWMQYRFSIEPNIPSLSSLTDVEQWVDTIQIQRGNPNLRTYRSYKQKIEYTYSHKYFVWYTNMRYEYYDKPIMEEFLVENNKLVRTERNQRNLQDFGFYSTLSSRKLKWGDWALNLLVYGGAGVMWSKGYTYYHRCTNRLIGTYNTLYYKRFGLSFDYRVGGGALWGETFRHPENRCYITLRYQKGNLFAQLGVTYPFVKYKSGSERISKVAPSEQWNYDKNAQNRFNFYISYRFDFGKKFKERNRNARYKDSDTGVLKY